MKKILLLAFTAATLSACSDDKYYYNDECECTNSYTVDFESGLTGYNGSPVVLGTVEVISGGALAYSAENVYWPKPFAFELGETDDYDQVYWQGAYIFAFNDLVSLGAYYDDGTLWDWTTGEKVTDTWGGFVLSRNADMTATEADWKNQFAVWAPGGANGTDTFVVGYDSNTAGAGWLQEKEYNAPQIDFSSAVYPQQVSIANSTFTYPFFTGEPEDSFVVEITGWKGGLKGNTVSCILVKGASKISDWMDVDLTPLGLVDKLTFKTVSSDAAMTPMYFCLDELHFDK